MKTEPSLKQYYVAVGTADAKLATLLDLLQALHANKKLALAVCCSSRDSLDNVIAGLAAVRRFRVFPVFSDMSEAERNTVLESFQATRAAETEPNNSAPDDPELDEQTGHDARQTRDNSLACVLVATDVVLKAMKLSLGLELIVHYDLPPKKDVYISRVSTLFGSGRERRGGLHVSINFIVAGQLEQFRNLEGFSSHPIEVMPIHISDVFGDPS
ncbi:hypothetical protein BSKO_05221 [Bryopsis sp. KO-2023]|nr:hypothetical protein BSKO_05216 [Bryopsis sp. KO-2023]GMH37348.1 hypothetical protein BSKO_05221 [Bryopsis sp. KO-2023]